MTTMLIAQNETRESGSFMGDQLCSLKAAYLFVENTPGVDRVLMSVSPGNEMGFLWTKFIRQYNVELIPDNLDPGDWPSRWVMWDQWRTQRCVMVDQGQYYDRITFNHYRELYLRIHGAQRQTLLCGEERGLGRRNIYQYWYCGQENSPEELPTSVDWFDDTLIDHPDRRPTRDVWISPHAKTQGNWVFTFDFWSEVVHRLVDADVTVTVGFDGPFCDDLLGHPCYMKSWGTHRQWMEWVCQHKLVACGNTGTGWLAAACGVPMVTMEPPGSQMPDHRYRQCGLRNIVEVVDVPDAAYVARRIEEEVRRRLVMTTGCYDVLHAGHVRHLERSRALGTKLVVALNSDASVRSLKGPERPINPEGQRKAVLEALRCVDEVRLFDGPDATPLIRELKPDVLTAGFGYTVDGVVGRDLVGEWGGEVRVTCEGDARDQPSTTKVVKRWRAADLVELCRAGCAASVNPFEKVKLMAEQFVSVRGLPGDVADLGTMRGGTALVLRRLAPDKHLHLFDTWAGTPYDDPLCHHKKGEWRVSLEECRNLVGDDELTHYHQGVFPKWDGDDCRDEHYRPAGEYQFCFVYVDMDTERATIDALEFFWSRLVPGGKILVDDYEWEPCAGVKKAVDHYTNPISGMVKKTVVANLYTCILEKS